MLPLLPVLLHTSLGGGCGSPTAALVVVVAVAVVNPREQVRPDLLQSPVAGTEVLKVVISVVACPMRGGALGVLNG